MPRLEPHLPRVLTLCGCVAALAVVVFTACRTTPQRDATPLGSTSPDPLADPAVRATFQVEELQRMNLAVEAAIDDGNLPGGVLRLERNGVTYQAAFGHLARGATNEPATVDTVYDIASLTKVVATTPAMMLLIERGHVKLDDTVERLVPEFTGGERGKVTVRQLLTHTSGLPAGIGARPAWSGRARAIELICSAPLQATPGTRFRYSDAGFILLAEIVERVTQRPFAEFVQNEFYTPLRMNRTRFLPPEDWTSRIAPTERDGDRVLRGVVHDPTARRMENVAGHAGLFSTAGDLARYARMILDGGELDGVRVFKPETIRNMVSVHTPGMDVRRGLGWDIDSGYSRPRGHYFPIGSFGHTGFTGTCLWIDPFSRTFWMFLGNRVHPDGAGNILPLQWELADAAGRSVKGVDFSLMPGAYPPLPGRRPATPVQQADTLNGVDVLARNDYAALKGLRVGLITNHTGRDRDGNATIDLLFNAPDVTLAALFSPEHGIRGQLDERVDDERDEKTGLPVYSLYGVRREPTLEQLEGLDALVFDIQDIGCRFYTYISTMGNCMRVAAKAGIKFVVLDRVNVINGRDIEGPVLAAAEDFVGWHPIPVRHGMTVGELARMFNAEKNIGADLSVIPIEGWRRDLWLDESGLKWVDTSPNMRSVTQAALYPGVGLLEMTRLSVGRGTDTPFELFGAPYVDATQLAAEMNSYGIRGVRFDPVEFTPTASKFKGEKCGGVKLTLVERDHCEVLNIGIVAAGVLHRLYPNDFDLERFAVLLKHPLTMTALRAGTAPVDIKALWSPALEDFKRRRETFLLY